MNISVFGLGYVGAVNIACLSKLGHTVYGCDVKAHKVDLIRRGESTVLEPQLDELISNGVKNGSIKASTDSKECIAATEMALICVGTPSGEDGSVNLNYILNTASEIAHSVNTLNKKYTLVFRSTIPPGTIDEQVMPELKKVLGEKIHLVSVAFLPEFLREGSAVKDFFNCARIIAGVDENESASAAIKEVFGFSESIPVIFTNFRTAEFVKYVDNAFHATKVAFANEVYSIGSVYGVDVKKANDLFLMDNVLNISTRYLRPGMPFGGSCLPKDSRAIIHLGKSADVNIPFFTGVLASNKAHQQRLFNKVKDYSGDKILLCGLTFKQNTDDIRESPLLLLLRELNAAGKQVKVYDPNLNMTTLRIEFPEVVKHVEENLDNLLNWSDTVVIHKPEVDAIMQKIGPRVNVLNCFDNLVHTVNGKTADNLY